MLTPKNIMKALLADEITIEAVEQVLKDYQVYCDAHNTLDEEYGIRVSAKDSAEPGQMAKDVANVMGHISPGMSAEMVEEFKNNNEMLPPERDSSFKYNKIQLIKAFRARFNTGLAHTLWAVEMLYEGHSDRAQPYAG